ncbi:undecaprenyl-diphosphate phosphatase [Gracilibacillus sp. S3-1-1]|uniref:Undecaprenyl-diphosphate phosphatase n=1 Tax=Gracilibacillus pellucidus TaxID=3095368 RepID=A0ACC6M483_9BACI|nr:undecaprenyl-diphosphate phosphatase [Gracilibacillus sp. S3-1-1]MDX8045775.1 undecaprenyl-diphosphate phosphatase [Gracilibacillus sp. S3-1-1]
MEDLIILIKYLFLGLVQGFTEPIPISSSGHLVMIQKIIDVGITENLSFEVLVNFGSLIAVLIIYWKDIIKIAKNGIHFIATKDKDSRDDFMFIVYLIIATIPAGLLGILLKDYIEGTFANQAKIVGITLVITGISLWIIRNLRGKKNDGALTIKDAVIVGFAQSVALLPGISRSGATIVAAMLLGMKQETALRFSFLMYIPVSVGTMMLSVGDVVRDPNISTLWIPYLIAFVAALVATYYSLRWFMNVMAKGNLKYFAFYCLIVGIIAFIIL